MHRSHRFIGGLVCASALVVLNNAIAQTSPGSAQNQAETLQEVVVTGSRLVQNGNDSPTPVTVVQSDDLRAVRPTNLVEALIDLPVFGPNFKGQQQNPGAGGPQNAPTGSQTGANVLNLRSLGPLRTLILFDGHRAPPNTPDGYVDADTIPQALVSRVDVVTGGASAVYGSDAISGVVNFVTNTKFQGIKSSLQVGRSVYNDDKTMEGSIAWGTDLFGGRGHVMASYSNRHAGGIDRGSARSWREDQRVIIGAGSAAVPFVIATGGRLSQSTFGGRINCPSGKTWNFGVLGCPANPLADLQFTSGGALVPFTHGVSSGNGSNVEIGGDGAISDAQQIKAGLDMNQLYGRFDFDITSDVHAYAMVADAMNDSVSTSGYQNINATMSRDNAYLLPQYRNALIAATPSLTVFTLGKTASGLPRPKIDTGSNQLVYNAGLTGSFGKGYKWDVSYFGGNSRYDVRYLNAINQGRLFAAEDSVPSGGWVNGLPVGNPVCRAALTNPNYAGCVPLDLFGPGAEANPAAISYIYTQVEYLTKIGSDDVSANLTGSPFNAWAGPVQTALSLEWHRNSYGINSNSQPTARPDCTGIANNCAATTVAINNSAGTLPTVDRTVKEAAVEFEVPLLKDLAWARNVNGNAAYRTAQYSDTDTAHIWKVGLTWDFSDRITARATRSRDFRAPGLDEFYRPNTVTVGNFTDLMPGTAVPTATNVQNTAGGNPNLKPELADTLTFGLVFRPFSSLSVALDAYKITVKNAIFQTQANDTFVQAVCYASKGASPLCSLITRALGNYTDTSAANTVIATRQRFINAAEQKTQGIDMEVNFRTQLAGHGLNLRLLTTYQPHFTFARDGAPTLDYSGTYGGSGGFIAAPVWHATAFADYKFSDAWSAGAQYRWRSSLLFAADPFQIFASPPIKAVGYAAVSLNYARNLGTGKLTTFFNVQNLFNQAPPLAAFYLNTGGPGNNDVAAGDDVVGRYYTLGLRYQL